VNKGWLRALDCSFATFILEQDPQAQASVLLAAAMTSHQLGRGHSCLDLVATLQAPDFVLSLPPEGEEGGQLPSQWLLGLDVAQWRRALCLSTMVEDRDEPQRFPERPLVLTGQRLYLRRYWNYERSIAQALSARLSVDAVTPEKLSSRLDALFPDTFEVNGERRSDWQKLPVRWRHEVTSASSPAAPAPARPPRSCACWGCCKHRPWRKGSRCEFVSPPHRQGSSTLVRVHWQGRP
jgi:hypothetical protein